MVPKSKSSENDFCKKTQDSKKSTIRNYLKEGWGTPGYKAPELLIIGAGFHEADIWAMGVMIYELLAGETPWKGYETTKMINAQYTFPKDFDEPTKEFIRGCLTCDPNKRLGWGEHDDLEHVMFKMDFFKDI